MQAQSLRIGALARAAGVGIETIRYYQRRKLLGTPPKPHGGQRVYPAEDVARLKFIKRTQALGFSLEEVASLVQLNDGTGHVRTHQLATRRLAEIEAQIADVTAIKRVLEMLIRECEHAYGRVPCPIVRTLQRPSELAPRRRGRPRPRTAAAVA